MRRKVRKNIGLIGLGIIGSRVAAGLRAEGFSVYVWNRTARPAPNFLGTPGEVASVCDVIQCFVADGPAVMKVLEAIGDKLTPEHTFVCNATIGPEATLEAARFVEERGARFLDAPFTGSKAAAERRELVYFVGGDETAYLRAKPALEATSKAIVRAGGVGDAALLKVVTNQIAAVSVQVIAEALAMVKKAGLPPEALSAALEHHSTRSTLIDMKLPKMISGDYEAHFSVKHMFKDVQLGIHLANALDIDTPTCGVTAGVMFEAMKSGLGDLDFSSIFKQYDEDAPAAGVHALEDRAETLPADVDPAKPAPDAAASAGKEDQSSQKPEAEPPSPAGTGAEAPASSQSAPEVKPAP